MITILVGTRPEIIKMAPVLRALQIRQVPFLLVHSNQHYSEELDSIFFRDLKLPLPDINLHAGSGSHAEQTAKIMIAFEKVCIDHEPKIVLVHGDTNTTLAGALVAKKLCIPLGHVEAGLRSFDDTMPEEINRKIVDRVADLLFAPTQLNKCQLLREGVDPKCVFVTGNTIVDAIKQNSILAQRMKTVFPTNEFILLTAHRPHNVDNYDRLQQLVTTVSKVGALKQLPIVWPLHPRSEAMIKKHQIVLPKEIVTTSPLGYFDMLNYLKKASLLLSDSGGIQEEGYVLKKPVITLRENTERPETLTANRLVGIDPVKAADAVTFFDQGKAKWGNELGNGHAGEKIVKKLETYLKTS